MADEQELHIVATFDDQASAGIERLKERITGIDTRTKTFTTSAGPELEGITKMTQGAADAAAKMAPAAGQAAGGLARMGSAAAQAAGSGGLGGVVSGLGNAVVGMTALSGIAATAGLALAGMAVSMATSGLNQYAEGLNKVSTEARLAGVNTAQYKRDISMLQDAGIDEAAARELYKGIFTVRAELQENNSKIREAILNLYKPGDRQAVDAQLNEVMKQPHGQALRSMQDMAERYGRARAADVRLKGNEELARRRAQGADEEQLLALNQNIEMNAISEYEAEKQKFLQTARLENLKLAAEPLVPTTSQQDEIALQKQRDDAAKEWLKTTRELGTAWKDIKDSIGSITIDALQRDFKDLVGLLQLAATASKTIERWMKGPPKEGTEEIQKQGDLIGIATTKMTEYAKSFGSRTAEAFRDMGRNFVTAVEPINEFFRNPSENLSRMLTRARNAARNLIPQPIKDWMDNPPERPLSTLFTNLTAKAGAMIPQSVKDFFNPPEGETSGLRKMIDSVQQALDNMIPQAIKDFFYPPEGGTAFEKMLERIKNALASILPSWASKLLGIGGEAPTEQPAPPIDEQEQRRLAAEARAEANVAKAAQADVLYQRMLAEARGEVPPEGPPISFQRGGVVTQPTRAIIGEAGPEAVVPLQQAPGGLFPGLNRLLDITGMREQLIRELPTLIPSAISALAEGAHHAGIPGAGLVSVGADIFGAGADVGLRGGQKAFSRREMQKYATLGAPILNALELAQMGLAREDVQGMLKDFLPARAVDELVGFSTAEAGGPGPRGITELFSDLFAGSGALDRSAAQQVNVSGTGRIRVDVRAPEGTRVEANGEGLFKSTEIMRQTQMIPADYGPAAATGVNAGTGSMGVG